MRFANAHLWLGLLPSTSFASPLQNVPENSSALLFSLRRCPLKRGLLVRRILVPSCLFLTPEVKIALFLFFYKNDYCILRIVKMLIRKL